MINAQFWNVSPDPESVLSMNAADNLRAWFVQKLLKIVLIPVMPRKQMWLSSPTYPETGGRVESWTWRELEHNWGFSLFSGTQDSRWPLLVHGLLSVLLVSCPLILPFRAQGASAKIHTCFWAQEPLYLVPRTAQSAWRGHGCNTPRVNDETLANITLVL